MPLISYPLIISACPSIVAVIGAGNGIGKAAAQRLARDGAHVVCADLDRSSAEATAKEIIEAVGEGIGVAGTGISNCGPAIGAGCDITSRDSVQRLLDDGVLAYGGLDSIVVTAGIFPSKGAAADDGEVGGQGLAVARMGGEPRLEFFLGHVLRIKIRPGQLARGHVR